MFLKYFIYGTLKLRGRLEEKIGISQLAEVLL